MAASMAEPPCRRIATAVCVASGWLVAAIPFLAATTERVAKYCPKGLSMAVASRSKFVDHGPEGSHRTPVSE
jgi:hypothetical protein